jgi:hypothetical protein
VEHHATVVLTDESADWRALAIAYDTVGSADAASAFLAALDLDAGPLTCQPDLYAGIDNDSLVVPIDD